MGGVEARHVEGDPLRARVACAPRRRRGTRRAPPPRRRARRPSGILSVRTSAPSRVAPAGSAYRRPLRRPRSEPSAPRDSRERPGGGRAAAVPRQHAPRRLTGGAGDGNEGRIASAEGAAMILGPAPDFTAIAAVGPGEATFGTSRSATTRGAGSSCSSTRATSRRSARRRCSSSRSGRARVRRTLGRRQLARRSRSTTSTTHRRWIAEALGPIAVPARRRSRRRAIAARTGALLEREGVAARATFVVDPAGRGAVRRVPQPRGRPLASEMLRVLEALRTREREPGGVAARRADART